MVQPSRQVGAICGFNLAGKIRISYKFQDLPGPSMFSFRCSAGLIYISSPGVQRFRVSGSRIAMPLSCEVTSVKPMAQDIQEVKQGFSSVARGLKRGLGF